MLFLLLLACECRLIKNNASQQYNSIELSKSNNAFVAELKPLQSFIEIAGHKFIIKNAWIENHHLEENFSDKIIASQYLFVMTLQYDPDMNIDLKEYISEIGNGPTVVWFFLIDGAEKGDIKLKYRSALKTKKKDKTFIFYKR